MSFDLAWNLLKASRYVEEQGNPGHPIPFNTVINRMITESGGDPQKASTELRNKIKAHILSSPQKYGLNELVGFTQKDYKSYKQDQKELFNANAMQEILAPIVPTVPTVDAPPEDPSMAAYDEKLTRRRPPSDATGPAQPRDNRKFRQSKGAKVDRLDNRTDFNSMAEELYAANQAKRAAPTAATPPAATPPAGVPTTLKELNKFIYGVALKDFEGTNEEKMKRWKVLRDNFAGQLNIPLPGEKKKVEQSIPNLVANPILPKEVIQQDIDMARNRHSQPKQMTLDAFTQPKAAEARGTQSLLNKPILPTSTSKVAPPPPAAEEEIRRITQPPPSQWVAERRKENILPITEENPGTTHTERLNQLLAQVNQQEGEGFPGQSKVNFDENGNII